MEEYRLARGRVERKVTGMDDGRSSRVAGCDRGVPENAGQERSIVSTAVASPDLSQERSDTITREVAERVIARQDLAELARMAYQEAFPSGAVHVNGQAVLDLITGEVRPSLYVEGHGNDPGFRHLLPLVECEAELKRRVSEEDFVSMTENGRRPAPGEIAKRLDEVYGSPQDGSGRPEKP